MEIDEAVLETSKLKLSMFEFFNLKTESIALIASNVCGWDQDRGISKIGNRALKIVDDTIGADIEVLESRLKNIEEAKAEEAKAEGFHGQFSNELIGSITEYNKLYESAWGQEEEMEFDPIVVSTKRTDGRKFNEGFLTEKHIVFRKKPYLLNPYKIFFDFEERGIIVTTK